MAVTTPLKRRIGLVLALSAVLLAAAWAFGLLRFDPPLEPYAPAADAAWSSYGADAAGTRYSEAGQITPRNVRHLREAWTFRTGDMTEHADTMHQTAFEATPILIDDGLVFCTPFNDVIALDPGTGHQQWRYRANVDPDMIPASNFVCRGVSHWRDANAAPGAECASRIFMATIDSRLISLDAGTGRPCSGFADGGVLAIDPGSSLEWPGEFGFTSPPAIIGDIVVIGSAIADNRRIDAPRGVVRAYDARSGKPLWQFDPIPRDAADPASSTWPEAPREGQANVWSIISSDTVRGLIFLPTSAPSVDFYGGLRPGDNRHANSVVAIEAATGRVVWSFQTVHHDLWDYDVPGQPGLYRIRHGGEERDVVVIATKTGLVFVLDRDTGEPVFPVEERAVPQGGVPGEVLSPTQPFPIKPRMLVNDRLEPDDVYGLTPWDKDDCRKRVAALRQDGIFTPPSLQGTLQYPFGGGGANWGSTAFHPRANLVIVNVNNLAGSITLRRRGQEAEDLRTSIPEVQEIAEMRGTPYVMTRDILMSGLGIPCSPPPWGTLNAIDMDTGEVVWTTPLGTTQDIAPFGIALSLGVPNVGGPITTGSGLIFIGAAMDDYLRAFDLHSGNELWKGRLPAGGQATPMTYVWKGQQYVVIAAGGNARSQSRLGDFVVAYTLPAHDGSDSN